MFTAVIDKPKSTTADAYVTAFRSLLDLVESRVRAAIAAQTGDGIVSAREAMDGWLDLRNAATTNFQRQVIDRGLVGCNRTFVSASEIVNLLGTIRPEI